MNEFSTDWVQRLKYLEAWQPQAPELWPWLKESNRAWGAGPGAMKAIERLQNGALAVVTGQQAGLLTGPLYTIYKAASAVILARQLGAELQAPVEPVFWLASEDHDFAEVRWAFFPVGAGQELHFPGEYTLTPAAEIPLDKSAVDSVLEQMRTILPPSEFTPEVFTLIRDAARGSFSDWCASLLCQLFREHGLVVLDSCGLPVRLSSRPVFAQAIEEGPEIHRLLAEAGEAMKARGRKPGLAVPPEHSHLFLLREERRLGLLRQGDSFVDARRTLALPRQELLDIAHEEPWQLSPNVVLRPLVQELVLPVLAVVGGPGELAYLEQLCPVFSHFGLQRPPVLPRMGGLLLEPAIARLLEKYGLAPTGDFDSWLEAALKEADSADIPQAFAEFAEKLQREHALLTAGLSDIDPQLVLLGEKNLSKIMEQVKWMEGKANAAFRKKHGDIIRHAARLKAALPTGGQQRLHNAFWYINKYPGFINLLMKQPPTGEFIIHLGAGAI